MIPYDFKSICAVWWVAWREHIANAKRYPHRAEGYCRAAMIANAEYNMYSAIDQVKARYL